MTIEIYITLIFFTIINIIVFTILRKDVFKVHNNWILAGTVFAVIGIFAPLFIYPLKSIIINTKWGLTGLGDIGDFLGGTMSGLLAFSSILFVTAAVIMQKEELGLQRDSLDLQTAELKDMKNQIESNNLTMRLQQFESAFFNMLNLHHTIVQNMKINSNKFRNDNLLIDDILPKGEISNRELIEIIYKVFLINGRFEYGRFQYEYFIKDEKIDREIFIENEVAYLNNRIAEKIKNSTFKLILNKNKLKNLDKSEYNSMIKQIEIEKKRVNKLALSLSQSTLRAQNLANYNWEEKKRLFYEEFLLEYEYLVGHYFRNFYHTIRFISESKLITENEKTHYRAILKAQLSSPELLMLFYNVHYSIKGSKLKDLLDETDFFDNHIKNLELVWFEDYEKIK